MDFTASAVRREILKMGSSSGLGEEIKDALPTVSVLSPVTSSRDFLEEEIQFMTEKSALSRALKK